MREYCVPLENLTKTNKVLLFNKNYLSMSDFPLHTHTRFKSLARKLQKSFYIFKGLEIHYSELRFRLSYI